jgi:hypothetical protein
MRELFIFPHVECSSTGCSRLPSRSTSFDDRNLTLGVAGDRPAARSGRFQRVNQEHSHAADNAQCRLPGRIARRRVQDQRRVTDG